MPELNPTADKTVTTTDLLVALEDTKPLLDEIAATKRTAAATASEAGDHEHAALLTRQANDLDALQHIALTVVANDWAY